MKFDLKKYVNEFSLGIAIILIYILSSYMNGLLINKFNLSSMPLAVYLIWNIIYEILILSIMLLLFNKKLEHDFDDIKINHKKYFSENFKYYLIGIAVMLISNVIIMYVFEGGISNNESTIRSILQVSPVYIFITGVLIAPIMEELVFRQAFKNIFKNKYLFILLSGIVFGGLHIISSLNDITSLLYLIPYCSLGIAFAYILSKTDNIFTTIGLHTMHNGILISIQILVLIFS
ncbi:MAG: type II CAAX endopeptidase family protein [Bacilli bacterium]|nr:type II CAAX endopeptidase family protein [Bacilli bacterium]